MKSCPALPSPGPLSTLAGVYQDVRGQRPEAVWKEAVALWTEWLEAVVPAMLGNTQLRPLTQTGLSVLSIAVDVVRNPYRLVASPESALLHFYDSPQTFTSFLKCRLWTLTVSLVAPRSM